MPSFPDPYDAQQAALGWHRCKSSRPAEGVEVRLRVDVQGVPQYVEGVFEGGRFRSAKTTLEIPDDLLVLFWYQVKEAA